MLCQPNLSLCSKFLPCPVRSNMPVMRLPPPAWQGSRLCQVRARDPNARPSLAAETLASPLAGALPLAQALRAVQAATS
jgi:hypothetical protein